MSRLAPARAGRSTDERRRTVMDAAEPPATREPPAMRASDQDRDEATHRLQAAFAEGRLDDAEFDRRMRSALTAVTRPELDKLSADLPAAATAAGAAAGRAARGGRGAGRRGAEAGKVRGRVQELGPPRRALAGPGPFHARGLQGQR